MRHQREERTKSPLLGEDSARSGLLFAGSSPFLWASVNRVFAGGIDMRFIVRFFIASTGILLALQFGVTASGIASLNGQKGIPIVTDRLIVRLNDCSDLTRFNFARSGVREVEVNSDESFGGYNA
jgi:hypothetical protein